MLASLTDEIYAQAGKSFVDLICTGLANANYPEFVAKAAKSNAKPKQCQKGFACGAGCVSKDKECRNPLQGQAKTYADWLKLQVAAGKKLSKTQQQDADAMGLNKQAKKSAPADAPATKPKAKATTSKAKTITKPKAADVSIGKDGFPSDQALEAALSSPSTSEKLKTDTFNKGGIYKVTVDGKEYFVKKTKKPQSATTEEVVFELAKRFGLEDDIVPVKATYLEGDNHAVSPFVKLDDFLSLNAIPAQVGSQHLDRERALKLASFDFIVGQTDRHLGNMALTDGKIKRVFRIYCL